MVKEISSAKNRYAVYGLVAAVGSLAGLASWAVYGAAPFIYSASLATIAGGCFGRSAISDELPHTQNKLEGKLA